MDYSFSDVKSEDKSLFSANVKIVFSPYDFVFLSAALIAPIIVFFVVKSITGRS